MDTGLIITLTSILLLILSLIVRICDKSNCVSTVSYPRLVREVILFSNDLLYANKIRYFPAYKISYYRHSKRWGLYCNNEIIIYINKHTCAEEIIDTTLHEIAHYIQHYTDKDYLMYNEYTKTTGYYHNPLEVKARKFATKWKKSCIDSLVSKGIMAIK